MEKTIEDSLQELKDLFVVDRRYTIIRISEMLAMTNVKRIHVKEIRDNVVVFTELNNKSHRLGRTRYGINLAKGSHNSPQLFDGMIFDGWEHPVKADTERSFGTMRGNACYNFLGEPDDVREWIDEKQLNPFFDPTNVVAVNQVGIEVVVYPEKVQEGRHAVIDRIMACNTKDAQFTA